MPSAAVCFAGRAGCSRSFLHARPETLCPQAPICFHCPVVSKPWKSAERVLPSTYDDATRRHTPADKRAGSAQTASSCFASVVRTPSIGCLGTTTTTTTPATLPSSPSSSPFPGRPPHCPPWSPEAMSTDDTCCLIRLQAARSPSSRDAPDPSKKS